MHRNARPPCILLAAVAAVALAGAAEAQQASPPTKTTATVAAKPVKPVRKPANLTSPQLSNAAKDWSIEDALPVNSPALRAKEEAPKQTKPFGRLQIDEASVGIETEPAFKDNTFADGRKVPGLEYDKRNAPTYFGLSLSVPNKDKSIFPFGSKGE